jgi:hypothetical protein
VVDIPTAVQNSLLPMIQRSIMPGAVIAVGVGSRGIANLPTVVRCVVEQLRMADAHPFIFPAMGSHGGATASGQRHVLAQLGITEASVGAEIRSTMDVQQIGQIAGGPSLFQGLDAAAADHTLLINRVKPHTDFRARLESGLAKMTVVGMGKHQGAVAMHVYGSAGFEDFLEPAARIFEAQTNLVGGIAIVENAYEEIAEIAGLSASEIGGSKEMALLQRAKQLMASLPFPQIDMLVVRQIGKNISGTGMDTNVLGRVMIHRQREAFGGPDIAVIAALDLTPQTEGNVTGIGLADVTTARVVRKIDWATTYTNIATAGILGIQRGKLPVTLENDRQALQVGMGACGKPSQAARIVFIQDTLTLGKLWVSETLIDQVKTLSHLSIIGESPLTFNEFGVMSNPWQLT